MAWSSLLPCTLEFAGMASAKCCKKLTLTSYHFAKRQFKNLSKKSRTASICLSTICIIPYSIGSGVIIVCASSLALLIGLISGLAIDLMNVFFYVDDRIHDFIMHCKQTSNTTHNKVDQKKLIDTLARLNITEISQHERTVEGEQTPSFTPSFSSSINPTSATEQPNIIPPYSGNYETIVLTDIDDSSKQLTHS